MEWFHSNSNNEKASKIPNIIVIIQYSLTLQTCALPVTIHPIPVHINFASVPEFGVCDECACVCRCRYAAKATDDAGNRETTMQCNTPDRKRIWVRRPLYRPYICMAIEWYGYRVCIGMPSTFRTQNVAVFFFLSPFWSSQIPTELKS